MDRRKTVPARLYFSPTRISRILTSSPEKGERKKLSERTASEVRKPKTDHGPMSAPAVVLRRTRREDPRQTVVPTTGNGAQPSHWQNPDRPSPNESSHDAPATYRRFSRKAARDFFGLRRLSRRNSAHCDLYVIKPDEACGSAAIGTNPLFSTRLSAAAPPMSARCFDDNKAHDFLTLLERMQSQRLDDQRCEMPESIFFKIKLWMDLSNLLGDRMESAQTKPQPSTAQSCQPTSDTSFLRSSRRV